MRTLTKTGIRILSAKYRSILIKCAIINASVFIVGTTPVMAVSPSAYTLTDVGEAGNWNYYDIVDGVKTYYRITPLSTNTNHYTIAPEGTTDFTIRSNTGTDSYHVTVPGTASSELRGSLSGNVGSGTAQLLYFDQNNIYANLFDAGAITNLSDANNYDIYADFVSNHTATYGGAIRNGGDNSTTAKIHIINGDFVINQSGYNNSMGNGGPGGAIVNGVNSSNATIDIIKGNFIGNQAHKDSGGAIMNQHLIGTITGDFLANSANSSFGGVISNIGDDSVIDSINGNFVSNLVTTVDSNWPGVGGAIYNSGTINNINGDFILNMADKNAGAIKNARTINNINGDFILNSAMGDGGAIRNSIDEKDNVTVEVATIANITGNFIGNHAEDNGGAIYNNRSGQITEIIGDFIDNAVTTYAGGAVYNLGQITGITGKFKNNSAGSTGQYAFGGAIYNSEGTIGTITGVADESGEIIAFEGNTTGTAGGAIYNNSSGQITEIIGDFNNNKTTNLAGGAIYNLGQITSITGKFKNNSAGSTGSEIYEIGGAIYNAGTIETITGVVDESGEIIAFENNTVGRNGGAVYNETTGTINNIIGSFKGNSAGSNGGAISNIGIIGNTADDTSGIIGSFIDNSAVYGGAIHNSGAITGITGSFIDNSATNNGGAINNSGTITSITGVDDGTGNIVAFENNHSDKNGGAIYNNTTSTTAMNITGDFISNSANSGGAIYNDSGKIGDIKGDFESNSANAYGGAIYNKGIISNITGNFSNNSSTLFGGAISNVNEIDKVTGNFTNNSATNNGGAISNAKTINFVAENSKNITFSGNYVTDESGNGGAIYNASTLGLYAKGANDTITFVGGTEYGKYDIDGIYNQSTLNINGFVKDSITTKYLGTVSLYNVDGTGITNIYGGTVNVAGSFAQKNVVVKNATLVLSKKTVEAISETTPLASSVFTLDNSTLNLQNNSTGTVYIGGMRLVGSNNIMLDADLAKAKMDQLNVTSVSGGGNIVISDIKLLSDANDNYTELSLFADGTTTDVYNKVSGNLNGLKYSTIYKYDALYDPDTGMIGFTRYNSGTSDDFNPYIYAPSVVANTTAAMTTQIATLAMDKMDDVVHAQGRSGGDTPSSSNVWVRVMGLNDNVEFNNFENIDSKAMTVTAGYNTNKITCGDCGIVFGAYAGYIGGKQQYTGNDIDQDGGYIGLSSALTLGDAFLTATVNGGLLKNKANNMYGSDRFNTLWLGTGLKAGYNYAITDSVVLQPNVYGGYTLVNTKDYTSVSGVKIATNNLNFFEVDPGLKLSAVIADGWTGSVQGKYAIVMDNGADITANDIALQNISTKNYFEYGIGIDKSLTDAFYLGAKINRHDGGRTGWNGSIEFRYKF